MDEETTVLGDAEIAALCEVWAAASAKWRSADDARNRQKARLLLGEPVTSKDVADAERACIDAVTALSRAERAVMREASKRIAERNRRAA